MSPSKPLGRIEFTAMIGVLFATIAFSIDSMLPALPSIAAELSPDAPNLAQLIVTSFVLGMGLGTFVVGPISDAFGRRPVIFVGAGFYIAGAIWAYMAASLEGVLAARVLAGIGVSAPRIVSMAMVRDLFEGRGMASVLSFAMAVFTIFPAIAPLIGAGIIAGFGWRAIFISFLIFSTLSIGWLALRQPETLPPENRRPLDLASIRAGLIEALSLRQMQLSILVLTLIFAMLFGMISSIQPIYDIRYGAAETFPWFFCAIAICALPAGPTNGILVTRLGMRPLIRRSLIGGLIASLIFAGICSSGLLGEYEIWAFFAYCVVLFANVAFTAGNLNALALEPLGHIAGLASSLVAGTATVAGAAMGAVIGQLFNGTPLPLAFSVALFSAMGAIIMGYMPREELPA